MIGVLPEFRLEKWFSTYEFVAPHSLTASDAQTMTVAELLALAGRGIDDLNDIGMGYVSPWGTPELREAVAARNGWKRILQRCSLPRVARRARVVAA